MDAPYNNLIEILVFPLSQKKKILAVDDEPDLLEIVEESLPAYEVSKAVNFEQARRMLVNEQYDLVILDIMGVRGLDLLDIAVERDFPAVMLTANALDPGHIMQSILRGAISFIPKEDIDRLDTLVEDLFTMLENGESTWIHTMKRLAPLLDERFTPDWRDAYKDMGLVDV
jgi:DNA-binding NtrC family response regulator